MGLLLSLALGGGGLLIVAIAAIVFLGGWALLLNRRVLIALAIAAAVIAAGLWLAKAREDLIQRGRLEERAAQAEINARAHAARQAQISEFIVEFSKRQSAAAETLRLANQRLELAQLERERKPHVTPAADARCSIPRGFVWDHDAALSGAAGRADLPAREGDPDRASGIALSLASREIGRNYAELGKCINELNAVEERRYAECVAWDLKYGTQSGCSRGSAPEVARDAQPPPGR